MVRVADFAPACTDSNLVSATQWCAHVGAIDLANLGGIVLDSAFRPGVILQVWHDDSICKTYISEASQKMLHNYILFERRGHKPKWIKTRA